MRIEKTVKVPELQRQERSIWKLGRTSKMTSITQSSSSLQQTTSQNSNNQLTDFPKRRQRTFRDMMSSVSSLFTVKDKSIGEFLREYQGFYFLLSCDYIIIIFYSILLCIIFVSLVRIFYDIILSGLTWVFLSFLAKIIP